MARRQLGGAGGSKLGQLARSGAATVVKADRPAIKRETVGSRRNHTVRLSGTEEGRLQRLITRVSEEAGRPISEADLMRGLLVWLLLGSGVMGAGLGSVTAGRL